MNLKRAKQIVDGGAWCHIRFITADVRKGTGGKIIEIAKCRLLPGSYNSSGSRLMLLPNKQIRTMHPILITHLNQEEVI